MNKYCIYSYKVYIFSLKYCVDHYKQQYTLLFEGESEKMWERHVCIDLLSGRTT